jgi:hypothetical protein
MVGDIMAPTTGGRWPNSHARRARGGKKDKHLQASTVAMRGACLSHAQSMLVACAEHARLSRLSLTSVGEISPRPAKRPSCAMYRIDVARVPWWPLCQHSRAHGRDGPAVKFRSSKSARSESRDGCPAFYALQDAVRVVYAAAAHLRQWPVLGASRFASSPARRRYPSVV